MLRPILLVEDNPDDIELTMIALEKTRLANPVVSVRDGEEALQFLRRDGKWAERPDESPAVILLDKKLPKLDGHEVLKIVRGDEHLRHIPVVMLTSSREEKDLLRSYDLGVNAYVVKPVAFDDFMAAINDLGMFWAVLNEPPPYQR
ncbi:MULTISPECIES: response regulator [Burkholderia]|uniref:Putative CheY-like response regulator receiver domain protein n=1 Tax=Burkholderia plantarii TaxID=41899 RepID=A0A0B6S7X4_BURPL|nr:MULTISPECIES: response regulator [Burkholderia]AJK50554.1 putative CheY-like response regulator receiver domain protein [Burkholderia plantarii]ALK34731.1 two-component response regulator [Burkholderia plantarii]WLE63752.1 response regulator [Burkholderia plantarii]GLZ23040.1 response regulator [Burkholderia plantarii]